MAEKKDDRFEITELFMAQADWDRCFLRTFKRGHDENGHPVVSAKIKVINGFVSAQAA
jgi:hypothetical protein